MKDVDNALPNPLLLMSRQATLNIGTIGHVAHGKSTIVRALSGIQTGRFKEEATKNMTLFLGYANAKIYGGKSADGVMHYAARPSDTPDEWSSEEYACPMRLLRHVSFVDCPGHEILMATMLNGAAVMDAALLLVAGNMPCPQPQTSEHLAAVEIMKLENIIILQNKMDLVRENDAMEHYTSIKEFVRGTVAEHAPVVPISAQLGINVDEVCRAILELPMPVRDLASDPRLIIVRSFDVNKPGSVEDEDGTIRIVGGVAGGSLLRGILRLGQDVEIRPGIILRDDQGRITCCTPIRSRIVSLCAEQNELEMAVPGGLIGVGLMMDPSLTRANRLVGQVLGVNLPSTLIEIEVSFFLLRRLLGVQEDGRVKKATKIGNIQKSEVLMVNVGSSSVGAMVNEVIGNDRARLGLTIPVCAEVGEKVALSRRFDRHWRLIGWGRIVDGKEV